VLTELTTKHIQQIPLLGECSSTFIQFLTKLFLGTKLGKNISIKTAKVIPLGYFMVVKK